MGAGSRRAFVGALAGATPALVLGALAIGAGGCFFGDLDYEGKTCSSEPDCPSGWSCSEGQCLRDSLCAFQPTNVRVAWTTPHTIRWAWDPPAVLSDFGAYQLRVGRGAGPESGGEVRVITGEENPELGWANIPRTDGDDRIRGTISLEHDRDTTYWGQLQAIDHEGCTWSSPTLTARTQLEPPADQEALVVFHDVAAGWVLPETVNAEPPTETSFDGSPYLSWTAGPGSSGENVQLGISEPLAELGSAVQTTAFIEARVAIDQDNDSYWTRVGLARDVDGQNVHSTFEPFTLRADGSYHKVEIPLSALLPEDGVLLTTQDTLSSFKFGCSPFEPGAVVRIDEVYIRW